MESPIHIGRSYRLRLIISTVGGFAAAFIGMISVTAMQSISLYKGQLIAGNTGKNPNMPTLHDTLQGAAAGQDPIINAMGSYLWWVAFIVLGLIFTWMLLRNIRLYA